MPHPAFSIGSNYAHFPSLDWETQPALQHSPLHLSDFIHPSHSQLLGITHPNDLSVPMCSVHLKFRTYKKSPTWGRSIPSQWQRPGLQQHHRGKLFQTKERQTYPYAEKYPKHQIEQTRKENLWGMHIIAKTLNTHKKESVSWDSRDKMKVTYKENPSKWQKMSQWKHWKPEEPGAKHSKF